MGRPYSIRFTKAIAYDFDVLLVGLMGLIHMSMSLSCIWVRIRRNVRKCEHGLKSLLNLNANVRDSKTSIIRSKRFRNPFLLVPSLILICLSKGYPYNLKFSYEKIFIFCGVLYEKLCTYPSMNSNCRGFISMDSFYQGFRCGIEDVNHYR